MEKWEKALELLPKRIKECDIQDEVYTMVNDIIYNNISKIEEELEMSDTDICDDDVAWYDDIMEDMRGVLYDRIVEWLKK